MLPLLLVLVIASVTDLRRREIPNWLTGAGALAGIALAAGAGRVPWAFASAILAGAPFLAAALIRPEGMGMGDVKLAGVLGMYLGWTVWMALVVGMAIAAFAGALAALGSRRGPTAVALPLAPFMALGVGLALATGLSVLQ